MASILVDCRFAGGHSGLGRYTRELTRELLRKKAHDYVLLVRTDRDDWLNGLPGVKLLVADIPHYSFVEQTRLPSIVRSAGADLLFSPHFNIPYFCPIPAVVTVHDFILHRYPNRASLHRRLAYRVIIRRALAAARSVIAVSPFTAREVDDLYGPSIGMKTAVILEGVSPDIAPAPPSAQTEVRRSLGLSRPFFLYVGNAKEHKNVQTLIDAYGKSGRADHELLLVTGGPEARRLRLVPGARVLPPVSDATLSALYSAASACVTASLYEGFCLPLLEALACGCPVIASDRTAIPALVGGHPGVALVEPTAENIASALRSIPSRPRPARVREWAQAADETATLLGSALA